MTQPRSVILVVNDEEGTRTVHASWLRRAGYEVVEAATGAEALEIVNRTSLGAVILDVQLPDMSGIDVGAQIKAGRASSAVPVLHLSATATASADRSAALLGGADGYLFEPVGREELIATTAALVRYHEARRTAHRLAARLEHLHQASLLMSAARTLPELVQYAASGLASVFGTSAVVLLAAGLDGRICLAGPNSDEPGVLDCPRELVDDFAQRARAGAITELGPLEPYIGATPQSAISTGLTSPLGEDIGALLVLTDSAVPEDGLMLDQFAQAMAVTLENQRLYALEHQIALTLQRAMLPKFVPQPPYLDIAVRYLAASEATEVGGDFYDAFERRPGEIMLAIGDVVGHSINAATVMAQLRHSLRAFASLGLDAADILQRLNEMLCREHPGITATLCIAEVSAAGRVTITNAGHIPPIVVDGDGTRAVREHGVLLGLRGTRPPESIVVPFGPEATLVLVTDGLIERRGEDLEEGLRRLGVIAACCAASADALCEQILSELVPDGHTVDDVAVLVARGRTHEPSGGDGDTRAAEPGTL